MQRPPQRTLGGLQLTLRLVLPLRLRVGGVQTSSGGEIRGGAEAFGCGSELRHRLIPLVVGAEGIGLGVGHCGQPCDILTGEEALDGGLSGAHRVEARGVGAVVEGAVQGEASSVELAGSGAVRADQQEWGGGAGVDALAVGADERASDGVTVVGGDADAQALGVGVERVAAGWGRFFALGGEDGFGGPFSRGALGGSAWGRLRRLQLRLVAGHLRLELGVGGGDELFRNGLVKFCFDRVFGAGEAGLAHF
jgi:hypothetical protein